MKSVEFVVKIEGTDLWGAVQRVECDNEQVHNSLLSFLAVLELLGLVIVSRSLSDEE